MTEGSWTKCWRAGEESAPGQPVDASRSFEEHRRRAKHAPERNRYEGCDDELDEAISRMEDLGFFAPMPDARIGEDREFEDIDFEERGDQ
jgi:hypothetical protein